ncbi:MAG TPA: isoprenylcysteine carboxylmethyltransferase family protein [Anaerolineales bacterium]|nr:isoprenylcysteine carboxylmethyltransferase family protein [Anaerolineales bacterium]
MNPKTDRPKPLIDAPVLLALAILLTFVLQWLIPLPFLPSLPSRILGAILFIGGFLLGFPALSGMLKANTTPNPHHPTTALVFDGTYRITRNPMYLGMLISYAGLFIFFQNPWFILFLPFLILLFTAWVIIPEEKYLEGKFGKEYLDFKARVRRWI